jgi:hypothetical protein
VRRGRCGSSEHKGVIQHGIVSIIASGMLGMALPDEPYEGYRDPK